MDGLSIDLRNTTPSSEILKDRPWFFAPNTSITFSVISDACSATAVGTSPELSACVAAAGRRLVLDKVRKSRKVTAAVQRW